MSGYWYRVVGVLIAVKLHDVRRSRKQQSILEVISLAPSVDRERQLLWLTFDPRAR